MLRTLVSGIALCAASSAFAGSEISFEDLKSKCADLAGNPQLKPVQVQITCSELSYYWTQGQAKPSTLNNERTVGVALLMKNFGVPNKFYARDVDSTPISCPSFVKIKRMVDGVRVDLTCQDILGINDLATFCDPLVAQRAKEDPGSVIEEPTRDVITLCPNH